MKDHLQSRKFMQAFKAFPLLFLVIFLPGLNPAAYLPLIQDWSYPHFLGNAMEIDRLFSAAFQGPGVRSLFAFNSLLTFAGFAVLVLAVLAILFAGLSMLVPEKFKSKVFAGSGVAAGAILLLGLLSLLSVANANRTALALGMDQMGMHYLSAPGMILLTTLAGVFLVSYLVLRRRIALKRGQVMRMTRNELRENLKGYSFISPYIIGFLLFIAYPMLFSLFSSFTYYNITALQRWYGLSNFVNLLTQDDLFWQSLGNTLYYVVFSVPLVIIIALILALLMNMRVRFMGFFRTIYYLPSVLSGVAVFLLWQWVFDPNSGLLNNALALIGIRGPAWLYDARWTKPALIIMRLWSTGGTMVLLLAALQGVPPDLYEAGAIDGAVGFGKFRHITLPMISPTLFFVMVTGISGAFQVYDSAYIMVENGGPGKSLMFYNLYLFNTAFKDQSMGKASAMAWFLFFIIMGFTIIQMAVSKRWVHYEGGTD